jgi:hypothetical protein
VPEESMRIMGARTPTGRRLSSRYYPTLSFGCWVELERAAWDVLMRGITCLTNQGRSKVRLRTRAVPTN